MTTKTLKVLLFVALIAAIAVPVTGMDFATGQAQVTKPKLQIEVPQDSPAKIAIHERAMALFEEKSNLYSEGAVLKAKYDAEGMSGLTSQDIQRLNEITESLKDVNLRIDQMNANARALITLTQEERESLENNLVKIRESNIPFTGVWTDENGEAVGVSFENQELADKYAPIIETIIDVPFYVEIVPYAVTTACGSLTSDCDPLLGGVRIVPKFDSTNWVYCSYSTAADRNVFWWVDYGFLTAAHCFQNNANGNDVKQPTTSGSQIGDLNIWEWDATNADCDCAFVLKTGSEMHWEAAYEGPNDSLTFGGFADPSVNDYVIMVGWNSTIHTVQVDSVTWTGTLYSKDSTPVSHGMVEMIQMDDWGGYNGDSGGTVHGSGTDPNYHGIISARQIEAGSGGKTLASKWSNIDGNFQLN